MFKTVNMTPEYEAKADSFRAKVLADFNSEFGEKAQSITIIIPTDSKTFLGSITRGTKDAAQLLNAVEAVKDSMMNTISKTRKQPKPLILKPD